MDHTSRFKRFLEKIRPTKEELNALRRAHLELRRHLYGDAALRRHIVSCFLQGSYRRATAVRSQGDHPSSDVDLVLVTNLDPKKYPPDKALSLLQPLLKKHYPTWRAQDRSLRIDHGQVALDLVMTSAPSRVDLLQQESGAEPLDEGQLPTPAELAAWQTAPLMIPDRNSRRWRPTHPLAQLAATRTKNNRSGGHYVNVVKAIKWWSMVTGGMPEHPRSYPLERLVEACAPDDIESVADGVTRTLEAIVAQHADRKKPRLSAHRVPDQDVLARVPASEFAIFVGRASEAAKLARQALDCDNEAMSAALWQRLFGPMFPATPIACEELVPHRQATVAGSLEQLVTTLAERGQLVVAGFEQVGQLKRMLEQAVQQLGIRVEWDPATPAELRDYLGVMLLSAMNMGLVGAGVGVIAGAVFGRSKETIAVCAAVGALIGMGRGHSRVRAGWRLRSWYDGDNVLVEVKVLR